VVTVAGEGFPSTLQVVGTPESFLRSEVDSLAVDLLDRDAVSPCVRQIAWHEVVDENVVD